MPVLFAEGQITENFLIGSIPKGILLCLPRRPVGGRLHRVPAQLLLWAPLIAWGTLLLFKEDKNILDHRTSFRTGSYGDTYSSYGLAPRFPPNVKCD